MNNQFWIQADLLAVLNFHRILDFLLCFTSGPGGSYILCNFWDLYFCEYLQAHGTRHTKYTGPTGLTSLQSQRSLLDFLSIFHLTSIHILHIFFCIYTSTSPYHIYSNFENKSYSRSSCLFFFTLHFRNREFNLFKQLIIFCIKYYSRSDNMLASTSCYRYKYVHSFNFHLLLRLSQRMKPFTP